MDDINPEQYVIGACLLSPDAIRLATEHVEPEDFRDARLELVFHAMVRLAKAGDIVDPLTVWRSATTAGLRGVEVMDLHQWMAQVSSSSAVVHYAQEVREQATRRRLAAAVGRFHQDVADQQVPPADAVSRMLETLGELRDSSARSGRVEVKTLGQILDTPDVDADWVVKDLLEVGDRLILTGHEGLGKTTWLRQLGINMAAGINPINLSPLPAPVRCVYVDVENSERQWRRETRGMAQVAAKYSGISPRDHLYVHAEGKRMDLRRDRDLGLVHKILDDYEPQVLFIGPIYKLVPSVQNDEEAAPLIAALDSLRERGVCLMMEAHPRKANGGERDLEPRGSAALMGWPEFGFGLSPTEAGAKVVRWRGERDRSRQWPHDLWRGGPFPWTADGVRPRPQEFVRDRTEQVY